MCKLLKKSTSRKRNSACACVRNNLSEKTMSNYYYREPDPLSENDSYLTQDEYNNSEMFSYACSPIYESSSGFKSSPMLLMDEQLVESVSNSHSPYVSISRRTQPQVIMTSYLGVEGNETIGFPY